MILDVTASAKRRWPEKADVRLDIDPSARPDIVGNAARLPFRDGTFDEVFCDPPHFVCFGGDGAWRSQFDKGLSAERATYSRFSTWPSRAEWLEFCSLSAQEIARVLRPGGRLSYKALDGSRSHRRTIDYIEAVDACRRAGLRLLRLDLKPSTGFLANGNRRRGKAATLVAYMEFGR